MGDYKSVSLYSTIKIKARTTKNKKNVSDVKSGAEEDKNPSPSVGKERCNSFMGDYVFVETSQKWSRVRGQIITVCYTYAYVRRSTDDLFPESTLEPLLTIAQLAFSQLNPFILPAAVGRKDQGNNQGGRQFPAGVVGAAIRIRLKPTTCMYEHKHTCSFWRVQSTIFCPYDERGELAKLISQYSRDPDETAN